MKMSPKDYWDSLFGQIFEVHALFGLLIYVPPAVFGVIFLARRSGRVWLSWRVDQSRLSLALALADWRPDPSAVAHAAVKDPLAPLRIPQAIGIKPP
ncbi:hypothetical protein [Yoonia sediminilitoris]|uniref:hypothetical protein n=1 Tax=Yoonia sediminilitoris TaxID=1286148 RepID=UPI0010575645|nr:hypothetical protein [Yoonia sediminilitoris]